MEEICPTYKELSALLNIDKSNNIVYHNIKRRYFNIIVKLLRISKSKVSPMTERSQIKFKDIIIVFMSLTVDDDVRYKF